MRDTVKLKLHWKKGATNGIEGVDDGALEADLKKIQETFCQTVVERAIPIIEKFAIQEIEGYYDEYDPEYDRREEEGNPPAYFYIRSDQMRNKSFQQFTEINGKTYQGGIEFDPSATKHMGGYKRGSDKPSKPGITEEQIYTSVWDLGYHGRTSYTYRVYGSGDAYTHGYRTVTETAYIARTPHRFDRLIKNASNQKYIKQLTNAGISAVQKQKYSVLKFG